MFTASWTQTFTYLLGVCPFSIAFLVFINSSISFVVTDLIGVHDGEGDAVGTLGFADELLALAACPLWGVLSDRIGVRQVRLVFSVDEGFMSIEIYHGRYAQLAILSLLLR
jgi:MFS family permease